MAERIVPGPSLTAVAAPVDRFVAPVRQEVAEDPMLSLARTLERVNPALQGIIQSRFAEKSAEEEAKGAMAEAQVDPSIALQNNREGWKTVIDQARAVDRAAGTQNADRLTAASPHFRRGVVKARTQRLGLALNDYLMSSYARNPSVEINGQTVSLQDSDDPAAIQAWLQQESAAYAERMGVGQIDPLLAAEVYQPSVTRAQESIMGYHTQLRLDRFTQESMDEMSAMSGMILSGAVPTGDGYDEAGMTVAANAAMANLEDVLGSPLKVISAFRDPEHNDKVGGAKNSQHTHGNAFDVDVSGMSIEQRQEVIRKARQAGFSGIGVYENSLHFDVGGDRNWGPSYSSDTTPDWAKEALTEPVGQVTKINPVDDIAARLQVNMDQFVSDGMDPRKANETVVNDVLTTALAQKNPAILDVLDRLQAGSGPLGNIGWVREKRARIEEQILDSVYQAETREYQTAQREREKAALVISTEGTRRVLADPTADISDLIDQAIQTNNPEAAKALATLQETATDRLYNVRTDHESYIDLRYRINQTRDPAVRAELAKEIVSGTGLLWGKGDAETLLDQLEQSERFGAMFEIDEVRSQRDFLEKTVKARFGQADVFGVTQGGNEQMISASNRFYAEMNEFVTENPEASKLKIEKEAQRVVQEMLNSTTWQNQMSEVQPSAVSTGDQAQINSTTGDASGVNETVVPTLPPLDEATKAFMKTPEGAGLLATFAALNGVDMMTYAQQQGLIATDK